MICSIGSIGMRLVYEVGSEEAAWNKDKMEDCKLEGNERRPD